MFKNPKVVGVLVAIAFLAVFKQVIWPMLPSFSKSDIAQTVASVVGDAPPVKAASVVTLPINISELGWSKKYKRDPFTLSAHAASVGGGLDEHQLTGVIVDASHHLAVINGEVVGIGEMVQDYTVTEIQSNFVIMEGPDGFKKLKF